MSSKEHQKIQYSPTVSFGNWLTMAGMAAGGLAVLATLLITAVRADERLGSTEKAITKVDEYTNKRIDKLEDKVEEQAKINFAIMQNVAMIARSQGLKPVEIEQ